MDNYTENDDMLPSEKAKVKKTKALKKCSHNVESIYTTGEASRQEFLDRARLNAKHTIPALLKQDGHSDGEDLYIPFQSLGGQAVNTLSEKLVTAIFPPNAPFIKSVIDDYQVEFVSGSSDQRSEVEEKLNERDRAVKVEVEGLSIRPATSEIMLQLLVSGNILGYLPDKETLQTYRLDKYVVRRSPNGEWLKIVIKEEIAYEVLPDIVKEHLREHENMKEKDADTGKKTVCELYTLFYRKNNMVHRVQVIKGYEIPGTEGRWPLEQSPVWPLRLYSMTGEDYGRAYVDSYIGDLQTAEGLSKAMVEGTAALSRFVYLVKPHGLTDEDDLAEAENLDVITGSLEDVTVLQADKRADFQTVENFLNRVEQRIGRAFLMVSSVQRDAERVTAEEIREVVGELESVLGGVYSLLANEFQLPFARRLIARMEKEKKIPDLSKIKGPDGKEVVTPKITGGLEALGRGQDTRTLSALIQEMAAIAPALKALELYVHPTELFRRMAVARNVDIDGLLKTEQEKQQTMQKGKQEMQQAQGMDLMKSAAGPAIKAAADNPEMMAQLAQQIPQGMPEQLIQQGQTE